VSLLDATARVCESVKKRIIPTPERRQAVEEKAEQIRRAVEQECLRSNLQAEVRLDGSVAKDTWLPEYVDLDIFMRVSPNLTKQQLRDICLPIAKRALRPHPITERFAEHPYIESFVPYRGGSIRVNVVPCYHVQRGEWLSATDRTPFHTDYIRQRLTGDQRTEIRLLKAFMRGIGGYGADIKTGGFSGMLCETLVIARDKFVEVLREFEDWKEDDFIDVEHYYSGRQKEVRKLFPEPLIVIDPVDKGRNLGAAVRPAQLWNFVSASRHFLDRPSNLFFNERRVCPLTVLECRRLMRGRGSAILCLVVGKIDAVVDILWSQLYRTERAIARFLSNLGFQVIRSASWSDEMTLNVLLFELETKELPGARRHDGPPVSRAVESSAFLAKHTGKPGTLSGPWIEGQRWVVEKRREQVSAPHALRSALRDGGVSVGVASLLASAFRNRVRILENEELGALIRESAEFAKFMRVFLSGRPAWLA